MTPDGYRFELQTLGGAARSCLAAHRRGTVLAVFRRSFYVAFDDAALVCVGPAGMGAGPLNALGELPAGLDWQASGLTVGEAVRADRKDLKIGRNFTFAFGAAADWSPVSPAPNWSKSALTAGLSALRREAGRYDLTQGLASLVTDDPSADGPLLQRGRAGNDAVRRWLADAGIAGGQPPDEVRQLVGLGPGLTPSGDDLIGGLMIALHAFGQELLGRALADWVLPIARRRTGRISLAHLACAGEGQGAAALHDAISGVAANDAAAIAAALAGLDVIGHSSGWDALAGAVTAISWLTRENA